MNNMIDTNPIRHKQFRIDQSKFMGLSLTIRKIIPYEFPFKEFLALFPRILTGKFTILDGDVASSFREVFK
jgi:hypothetical protein